MGLIKKEGENSATNIVRNLIENIIPKCDEIFIEVGYFFFSGFEEIYKSLEDKKVNILIGMDFDKRIAKAAQSTSAIRDTYFEQLEDDISNTDLLDSNDSQNSYNLFLKKLKDNSLKIKCWREKNDHTKRFIFQFNEKESLSGQTPGYVITGSSNFSKSGFVDNIEGNHLHTDKNDFNDYKQDFLERWESHNSINILDVENYEEFIKKVDSKIWVNKKNTSPYELFVKILDSYYSERDTNSLHLPSDYSEGELLNIRYQTDAISRGLEIISKHSGVIIADVVGLGKSIIATAIAKNLGLNTIVICPPHLKEAWENYTTQAQLSCNVITRGKIKDSFRFERSENLIIIDEAQYYRNDLTQDYTNLHKLCKNNKVILISATPFNNKPQDIFNMTKLFQVPSRSTILTVDSLSDNFKDLVSEYNKLKKINSTLDKNIEKIKDMKDKIATEIRLILSPIIIRRSRLDLQSIDLYKKDLENQNISFPKRKDPILLDYNLGSMKKIYLETLDVLLPKSKIKNYKGVRYKSTSYVKKEFLQDIAIRGGYGEDKELLLKTLENISDFMKRLLVRRFESSITSFMKTLNQIISSNIKIKEYYEKLGMIPIYKKGIQNIPDVDDIIDDGDDDILIDNIYELNQLSEKGMWCINASELKDSFIVDLKNDIEILQNLENDWLNFIKVNFEDPKYEILKKELVKELSKKDKRKVIIFSEFADTASYLQDKLSRDKFNSILFSSKISKKNEVRIDLLNNFDSNSKNSSDKFNVLVATDAISEGFNLSRAGTIFNYDIPYNPTKVIQRFGRINRINKKVFEELYIYNFFPSEIGEKEVRTKQIAQLKIGMFQALFGDDTKALSEDEDLESYFSEQFKKDDEQLNAESEFENLIYNLRETNPEFIKKVRELPNRIRVKRKLINKQKFNEGILLYSKKGDESFFHFKSNDYITQKYSISSYLELVKAETTEKSFDLSNNFEALYKSAYSSIFRKVINPSLERSKKDALNKIEGIKNICDKKFFEYLDMITKIIEEFDDLPGGYLKRIRQISDVNIDDEIRKLQLEITEKYLYKILDNVRKLESEEPKLIISQEFVYE